MFQTSSSDEISTFSQKTLKRSALKTKLAEFSKRSGISWTAGSTLFDL